MRTLLESEARFPVKLVSVAEATGMTIVNRERSSIVVGTFDTGTEIDGNRIGVTHNVLGIHSGKYSLIPNDILFDSIHTALNKTSLSYEVNVSTHNMLQFNIGVKFLEFEKRVGDAMDKVNCSFNIRTGYDGKLKFGLHGVAMKTKSNFRQAYRLSTFRQICSNGLHGWVDEVVSFEEYVDALRSGKKVKSFEENYNLETISQDDVKYSTKHTGIDMDKFVQDLTDSVSALAQLFDKAVKGESNTLQVYDEMAMHKLVNSADFFKKIGDKVGKDVFPLMLHEPAIRVMQAEMNKLGIDEPNAWLAYNGANHVLNAGNKTIVQNIKSDEMVFNAMVEEVFA